MQVQAVLIMDQYAAGLPPVTEYDALFVIRKCVYGGAVGMAMNQAVDLMFVHHLRDGIGVDVHDVLRLLSRRSFA